MNLSNLAWNSSIVSKQKLITLNLFRITVLFDLFNEFAKVISAIVSALMTG